MLFEIVFQSSLAVRNSRPGCDLMLFEIVFQWPPRSAFRPHGCDLMLFEIVFQSYTSVDITFPVVI